MSIPILKVWNEETQQYEGVPAIRGEPGYTPKLGVDYWTEEDKAEIVMSLASQSIEMVSERYSQSVTYHSDTYTDVSFDIAKDGYTAISIMPRSSTNPNVLVVGYGFYDNADQGDVDRTKATITYNNISSAEIAGKCNLDVVYLRNTVLSPALNLLELIYPVGSIYLSASPASPASLMGGTWEQLKDAFLLGAGDNYTAGSTGGEAEHTLTTNEMPSHAHQNANLAAWPVTEKGDAEWSVNYTPMSSAPFPYTEWQSPGYVGGNAAHNNMPPYLTVYMWKRVA